MQQIRPENNIERFVEAQECRWADYDRALSEIAEGQKRSHWMWYIFPQIHSLGKSDIAQFYALKNIGECIDYLNNEYLYNNIYNICLELLKKEANDPIAIFGAIDARKLQSSMTLFNYAFEENKGLLSNNLINIFAKVLDKYYQGFRDKLTLYILK